ncbi:hypothetical protein BD408DRAFT_356321 [Parasitella parasitica]|nr:hypothetical protein BD408DRAFT_356321 [Parasitella parasitica]
MLRNSEMEGSPEAAIVQWINTFTNISHQISHTQDLSDGIILFEVVSDIDKYFKSIAMVDVGTNWVLKKNNLKKLLNLVYRYYEDVLGMLTTGFPKPDLDTIAKNSDTAGIVQLCKFILTIAVMCPNNMKYIERIQEMSPANQNHVKSFIEETLEFTETSKRAQEASIHHSQDGYENDGTYRSQSELTRISKEKEELEIQNRQLIDEHSALLTKYVLYLLYACVCVFSWQ